MTQLKEQPTYYLSGYVYANEWNKFGAVTSLAVMAENNKEYKIFPDKESHRLKEYNWEFMEIEYISMDKIHFGPWIKIISFANRDHSSIKIQNDELFDTKKIADAFVFENDFKNFDKYKNFDEDQWMYREAYYSINREV